jgi:hypothetical protein
MESVHLYLLATAAFVGATLMIAWLDHRSARPKQASLTRPQSEERSK